MRAMVLHAVGTPFEADCASRQSRHLPCQTAGCDGPRDRRRSHGDRIERRLGGDRRPGWRFSASHRDSRLSVDPLWMLNGERELIGSRYVTRQEIVDALELVRRGHVRPIVSRTFAL
jgi:hypothetical protein